MSKGVPKWGEQDLFSAEVKGEHGRRLCAEKNNNKKQRKEKTKKTTTTKEPQVERMIKPLLRRHCECDFTMQRHYELTDVAAQPLVSLHTDC